MGLCLVYSFQCIINLYTLHIDKFGLGPVRIGFQRFCHSWGISKPRTEPMLWLIGPGLKVWFYRLQFGSVSVFFQFSWLDLEALEGEEMTMGWNGEQQDEGEGGEQQQQGTTTMDTTTRPRRQSSPGHISFFHVSGQGDMCLLDCFFLVSSFFMSLGPLTTWLQVPAHIIVK
jgi:hypothetical protein